jgi:hypothetical protein
LVLTFAGSLEVHGICDVLYAFRDRASSRLVLLLLLTTFIIVMGMAIIAAAAAAAALDNVSKQMRGYFLLPL